MTTCDVCKSADNHARPCAVQFLASNGAGENVEWIDGEDIDLCERCELLAKEELEKFADRLRERLK